MAADTAKLKERVLAYRAKGLTVEDAMDKVRRHPRTYDYWRKTDPAFKLACDAITEQRHRTKAVERPDIPPFDEFCEQYLRQPMFYHQLQWWDVLEGREPRDLHPSMRYNAGRRGKLLINTPVFHCAVVDTPVLSARGWTTIGDVTEADLLFDPLGNAHPVLETWEPDHEVPVFEVEFGTGDTITTDAGHKWVVQRSANHAPREMTTAELMADLRSTNGQLKWRVRMAQAVDTKDADLPIDPYILGYWLGDGETGGSRFAVSATDKPNLLANLEAAGFPASSVDDRGSWATVYPKGLRTALRHLGVMDAKRIPAEYMMASVPQRLALLQGLLDSDGTINPKDGQVTFYQHPDRTELLVQVYRLIASLGHQPRRSERLGGPNPIVRICFKPDGDVPVFRLERKSAKQKTTTRNSRTEYRTIKDIRPAGNGRVKCITVLSDTNEYLIGNGLIPTHNAKSTTITVNYATYRICRDPNVRIIIVSKTREMAKQFLGAIKNRLSHPSYRELQVAFAPEGGYKASAESWTTERIFVGGDERDSGEKDPTVQALGIGGQIYGARADLIILDDCVTSANAHEFEKQISWLQAEVETRLTPAGKLLVVGTRIAPQDLYSELQNPERYTDGRSPWTSLTQPVVLDFAEDPREWTTLWPKAQAPCECHEFCNEGDIEPDEDGLFPKWDGQHMNLVRSDKEARTWALVYMQQGIAQDAIFHPAAVNRAVDNRRQPGVMTTTGIGHRPNGMEGLYVVAGLDLAGAGKFAGFTASVVMGVDRATKERWVLDVYNQKSATPTMIRQLIKDWTKKFSINEWRIESNALQTMVTQDDQIRDFLSSNGCLLTPHHTGKGKWDANFGVQSMAQLFGTHTRVLSDKGQPVDRVEGGLIRLPAVKESEAVKRLVEQLITWAPETKNRTDIVMALWFAEIRAREIAEVAQGPSHMQNKYLGRGHRRQRAVVNLDLAYQDKQNMIDRPGWSILGRAGN